MGEDYVYDIYYREAMPDDWVVAQQPRTAAQPPRPHASVPKRAPHAPPMIGRAARSDVYSPVPVSRGRFGIHATSAPGFEHLAPLQRDSGPDPPSMDDWDDETAFLPVHLHETVGADGCTSMMAVPMGEHALTEDDLVNDTPDAELDEDDEDSNDEDFYRNNYPDRDEWASENESDAEHESHAGECSW